MAKLSWNGSNMDIGVLGGTFDPIHLGHLIIAEEARLRLGLAEVFFLPAGQPWLKGIRNIAAKEHRLEMIRLAIGSNLNFKVSTIELDQPGPSYSVESIPLLNRQLGVDVRLYFLVGIDALAELHSWKEPARLVDTCQLVGVTRPGYRDFDWSSLERVIPGASQRIVLLEVPEIGISSSEIRERVARGLSIRYLVPEPVERYIREHGLYTK